MALTVKRVTRLMRKGEPRGRYLDGGPNGIKGLYLATESRTNASWTLRYQLDGKAHWLGLGSARTFSLEQARQRAKEARQRLADGVDPITAKRADRAAKKAAAAASKTFKECAAAFIEGRRHEWRSGAHEIQWSQSLRQYVYPHHRRARRGQSRPSQRAQGVGAARRGITRPSGRQVLARAHGDGRQGPQPRRIDPELCDGAWLSTSRREPCGVECPAARVAPTGQDRAQATPRRRALRGGACTTTGTPSTDKAPDRSAGSPSAISTTGSVMIQVSRFCFCPTSSAQAENGSRQSIGTPKAIRPAAAAPTKQFGASRMGAVQSKNRTKAMEHSAGGSPPKIQFGASRNGSRAVHYCLESHAGNG